MYSQAKSLKETITPIMRFILIFAIAVGVIFRFVALDHKVYGFDEVHTNLRVGGWSSQAVDEVLFQNQIIPASQLQQYQSIKPGSTIVDTLRSLAVEDPQHPPLYFLLARQWMLMCGSSITASRSLPALLSLLSLPLMYLLAKELFDSGLTALLATTLIAISPLDILFAQTARQYSLLTVLILASSYALVKLTHSRNGWFWGLYIISSLLGLYTHLFFSFTLAAHGAYVLLLQLNSNIDHKPRFPKILIEFIIAFFIILGCYTLWMGTLLNYLIRAASTINWTNASVSLIDAIKLSALNFSAILIDPNLGFNDWHNYLIRLPILLLIILAIYKIGSTKDDSTRLFILTSIFIPFLMLLLPDILFGGKRATVTRYLIPCLPGIQLAIADLFSTKMSSRKFSFIDGSRTWQFLLVVLLTGSIISCRMSAFSPTWWTKGISYWNAEVIQLINTKKSPLVVSDKGDFGVNKRNLISLSYKLNPDVKFLLMDRSPNFYLLPINSTVFVYAPSKTLQQGISPKHGKLEPVVESQFLWQLKSP
ncbi:MAG: glycosyltransferase family 39 protein [Microcoleaceae cyanobacterium]